MAQMHLTPLSEVVDEVWGKACPQQGSLFGCKVT